MDATEKEPEMTDKLFTHVGVATYKNKTKLRYTNGNVEARVKILNKSGFTGVEFHPLPSPMTKSQAISTSVVRELAAKHNLQLSATSQNKDSETAEATPEAEAA